MSKFIPHSAVVREYDAQQNRKQHGLKTGDYIKYPDANAKDHFVVKSSKLYDKDGQLHPNGIELKERMDRYLALVELQKADIAPKEETK